MGGNANLSPGAAARHNRRHKATVLYQGEAVSVQDMAGILWELL